MPLTDRDPNISGRTSRASNASGGSKRLYNGGGPTKSDALSAAPGVMSMMRTTTEFGGLGTIDIGPGRNTAARAAQRRSG
ncbi:hypothetical protein LTS18_007185, partial [Coniosporium uncinatum]